MFTVFLNGLVTGLILQIAVGPIFFHILNISLQRTLGDGFIAVTAVTLVDYLYIILAIFGVGKLLEKDKVKKISGIIGAFILILFGMVMIYQAHIKVNMNLPNISSRADYWGSFISTFILTISNPLTILFWTSLFTSKAIENNYSLDQQKIFGVAAGFATLIFLGLTVLICTLLKTAIPLIWVHSLNIVVGLILIFYGVIRLYKLLKISGLR
ncbi:MAG: LysE family translocator [Spirochaetes bacterium]|nr:LysE family translocator [Spirochaetota bacterium]